jgi:hypothetical protein
VAANQDDLMIFASTDLGVWIDLGNDEPGMTLQYRDVERGYIVWLDYQEVGEVVKQPVDIEVLPAEVFRLAQC